MSTPVPHPPTPAPSHSLSHSPAPARTTGSGGVTSGIFHFMTAHWIVPLVIVAWIGVLYGWKQLRSFYAQRGRAVAPLGSIVRNLWRFALKEDRRPLVNRPKKVAARLASLTGTRFYLLLVALTVLAYFTGLASPLWFLAVLALTLWRRSAPVLRTRRAVLMQMWEVANAECKYPKGANLSPWGYVNIQSWENLVQPGKTIVSYPAGYQASDVKTRDKFERQFNATVSEENTWTYEWEPAKNRVVCQPTSFLPTMAPYPGPGSKWNEFVLGVAGEGKQAVWDVSTFPHALICGPTGSGKSVTQRMILFHALAHSDTWKIVGVDPKMVEMGWLSAYPSVLKIALTLEDGVEVVQSVRDEMMRRYDEMSALGVNHFQKLDNPPPALLCMVDETFNFLSPEGIKSDEGKERDALHARAASLLGEIARLGRAAGVHLVLATQRPDATVIKGEMKNNLDCRIAAGRLDTTPSLMVLDSEAATRLPKIKGRSMIRLGGDMETYQGYFAEQNWYDEWLAAKEAGLLDQQSADDVQSGGQPGGKGLLAALLGRFTRPRKAAPSAEAGAPAADPGLDVEELLARLDPGEPGEPVLAGDAPREEPALTGDDLNEVPDGDLGDDGEDDLPWEESEEATAATAEVTGQPGEPPVAAPAIPSRPAPPARPAPPKRPAASALPSGPPRVEPAAAATPPARPQAPAEPSTAAEPAPPRKGGLPNPLPRIGTPTRPKPATATPAEDAPTPPAGGSAATGLPRRPPAPPKRPQPPAQQ